MITEISKLYFFFSLTNKYTNSAFCSWILFSIAFFKIKPTQRRSLWFLEKQGPAIDYIYGLLLLSRAPQDSIDATVLSRLFPLL